MASNSKVMFYDGVALTAASNTSSVKTLQAFHDGFIAYLYASSVNAATTVSVKLQHSPDQVNWFDFATFANLVGVTGQELVPQQSFAVASQPVLGYVRAVVTLAGVTKAATVKVELWFQDLSY